MSNMAEGDFAKRFRLDFKTQEIRDPDTGEVGVAFVLDPVRYKLVANGNEQMVVDQLDNWAMPLAEVQRMLQEAMRREPAGMGPTLGSARDYIEKRQTVIRDRLRAAPELPYKFVDHSEEYLAGLPDGVYGFAVLSVDLVGSTKLSNTLDTLTNARVIGLALEEFAAVVPFFHARILKFTGDGVLAYIPPPSFLTANDNAIDCALTMRGLIRDAINPALAEFGYPNIDVRIGIESGQAVALTVGHVESKRQRDLIGMALSLACKVQASGKAGEIRLGQVAYQNLHTMWKRGCESVPLPGGWDYKLADGRPYPLHLFVANGAITS